MQEDGISFGLIGLEGVVISQQKVFELQLLENRKSSIYFKMGMPGAKQMQNSPDLVADCNVFGDDA